MTLTLYLLLLGFFIAHELDAVTCREWRLLYVLRAMPEESARTAFVALHVPLVAGLAWTVTDSRPAASAARVVVALFAVVHGGLHYRLRRDPAYAFHSVLSVTLIAGAAACGAAYVLAVLFG